MELRACFPGDITVVKVTAPRGLTHPGQGPKTALPEPAPHTVTQLPEMSSAGPQTDSCCPRLYPGCPSLCAGLLLLDSNIEKPLRVADPSKIVIKK